MRYWILLLACTLLFVTGVAAQQPRDTDPDTTQVMLTPVAEGFTRALYVTNAGDGSGRLFVLEQGGKVSIIAADDTLLSTPFLDLTNQVSGDANGFLYSERGLLGLAFHPDYAENGKFYVNYTERDTHATVIAEYRVSADANLAEPASGRELLRIEQPFANHNGGHMAFGPDGYLYISSGDGGSAGDPLGHGQNPLTLLGSILRIDVNTAAAPFAYAIPADNPFVGTTNGLPEVWAYGVRNVWRFSFDRLTGDLYMGDVGQNIYEEINFHPANTAGGQNYGWNVYEGFHLFSGAAALTDATAPILEYPHQEGDCSVTGGYVYRGEAIPTLQGAYLFGDFCSGRVRYAYLQTDGLWRMARLMQTTYAISSFGEGEDGELYLVHYGSSRVPGTVFRFTPAG